MDVVPHVVPESARGEVVLLCGDAEVASWPLVCGNGVDLAVVDDLARLSLAARRQGCSIWLRQACPDLVGLLQLVGLAGVLQVGGQAEEGEEAGVEEVVVPDDPVA
jgi:hypothetical protein